MTQRSILAVAAALLLLVACGDDDGGRDGSTVPGMDGSVPPGSDGSVPPGSDGSVPPGSDGGCVPTFEICGDRMDQNCDGRDTSCGNTDGDFFDACRPGEAPPTCDCDDSDPNVYPGGAETCNGVDDDCDGRVDEIAACCAACTGMEERADTCTPAGDCVCSTEGAGDAVCPAGLTCCSTGCVDTQTDFGHCGLCEAACTSQADNCTGGICQCGTEPACDCDVMCVSGACSGGGCG